MSDPYPEPVRRLPESSRSQIAMDYSPARTTPIPLGDTQLLPGALDLALASLARATAGFERGGNHDAAITLLDQLKTMLATNRPKARRMMQEAIASLDPTPFSEAYDIAVAEREVTYAVLRMEDAIEGMPTSTTRTAHQMHLDTLVELRAAYSKKHPFAVNGNRGCI